MVTRSNTATMRAMHPSTHGLNKLLYIIVAHLRYYLRRLESKTNPTGFVVVLNALFMIYYSATGKQTIIMLHAVQFTRCFQ